MNNPGFDAIMEVLDPPANFYPWHGGPTLMGALRGVDAVQASWKPAPDRKSIWELALHIAYWNYSVRRYFDPSVEKGFTRSPSNFPKVEDPTDENWKKDKFLVSEEHNKLIFAIQSFPESRLGEKTKSKKEWTYGQLMMGVTVHDAYHIGQIQLMKRLYASMDTE